MTRLPPVSAALRHVRGERDLPGESVSSEPPTMAPTLAPSKTSIPSQPIAVEDTLSFNDTGGRINSSEGVALAALGLFAVLTFFPFFSH